MKKQECLATVAISTGEKTVADNSGGNSILGVIVGALLVVVLGIGAYLVLGHNAQPSWPSLHVTVPSPGK